ncbi:MAG: hypothetical protein WCZ89_05010 [Phycisphaerae bacterium]
MNTRQKKLLENFVLVLLITIAMIIGLLNFKDWVNYSESMRAMQHLGQIVMDYREKHGSVPPNYFVEDIRQNLEGAQRIGNLKYRARWIEFDAKPDTILAYGYKDYKHFLFGSGAVVLRLDGRVEWLKKSELDVILAKQQSPLEIEMEHKKPAR